MAADRTPDMGSMATVRPLESRVVVMVGMIGGRMGVMRGTFERDAVDKLSSLAVVEWRLEAFGARTERGKRKFFSRLARGVGEGC